MALAATYRRKPHTDIFTADTDINKLHQTRTVPMKVLLLGLGRTGTASIRTAMRRLGYMDTYHMMNCSIENPPDALLWHDALRAKYDGIGKPYTRQDWDRLLGNCQAICDWPAVAFAQELIDAYPEAKVIMTTRDVDSWHNSTMRTVWWRVTDPELRWLSHVSWAAGMYYPMLKKFFDTFFKGDFPTHGKQVFRDHYAAVKAMVPPDRYLEFSVKDGWEPLCRFLGNEMPKGEPFPRVNDNNDFVERSRRRNRMQMLNVLLGWAEKLLLIGMVMWLVKVFCF